MKLSQQQFDHLLDNDQLVVSLMGMSNIGKTYWSKQLHTIGFEHINCDNLIEAKLGPRLTALGYSGIQDVSRWMGQPYDERFSAHQQTYLSFEKEVVEKILAQNKNGKLQNTVIDTTGSVIHTGRNTCTRLKKCSLVVYIEATENMKVEMFNQYIKQPKPVVFGDMFKPRPAETNIHALSRCYRTLLDRRSKLYTRYADVVIPYTTIRQQLNPEQFMALIKQAL